MPVLTMRFGGEAFSDWTEAEITRDLAEISGSFRLTYDDQSRIEALLPRSPRRQGLTRLNIGQEVRLELDGELVMLGRIEELDIEIDGDRVSATICGRDMTGNLVEGAAAPNGPVEYKGLTALQIAQRICKPYGIPVRAEVDVGALLVDYGIDIAEPAMSAIDKAAKQRAVLVVSDGIGGLVLTRSGTSRAPAPLSLPGNAVSVQSRMSLRDRYSDYYVKGQVRHTHARTGRRAPLDGTALPLTSRAPDGAASASHSRRTVSAAGLDGTAYPLGVTPPPLPPPAQRERAAIIPAAGHAHDPAVPYYRPRVWVARTQSGAASAQVLAEWRMRVARARGDHMRWRVPGWRAGPDDVLWRPNEIVSIQAGPAAGYDMLVQGVTYAQSDQGGSRTELTVVGKEAFDLEPLPDSHRRHGRVGKGGLVTDGLGGTGGRGGRR